MHEVLSEDLESPPPPYTPTEYSLAISPKTLTGNEDWVIMW